MHKPDDVAQAYNAKYSEEAFKNSSSYYLLALNTLNPAPGGKLLDIACGLGDLLYFASQRQLDCYGIDLSIVAVKAARTRAPLAKITEGNAEILDFADETFDYVTSIGSLEHLLDPGKGLVEIRRVLKWGGYALILVPNSYYLPDIIWQVWHRGYGPNHKQVVERFAALNEWRGFIESGGLQVKRTRRYIFPWPRVKGDWAWYKQNPRRLLGLCASPFIPFNLSNSFLYLCYKDPASQGKEFHPPYWPPPPRLVDLG
jgi:ubiquinone/menaquinone biosynthesis C-methylase UbiE